MKTFFKALLILIILLTLGLVSGHFTFKLLSMSKTVLVPDLRGKNLAEANDLVRRIGLYLRIEGEDFDQNIPVGRILRQDIPSASKVKEGREIRIILSRGPRFQNAPYIIGQSLAVAESSLQEKGIKIDKVIYVHHPKSPKDTIIAQRPESTEKGSETMSVIVSAGDYDPVWR